MSSGIEGKVPVFMTEKEIAHYHRENFRNEIRKNLSKIQCNGRLKR